MIHAYCAFERNNNYYCPPKDIRLSVPVFFYNRMLVDRESFTIFRFHILGPRLSLSERSELQAVLRRPNVALHTSIRTHTFLFRDDKSRPRARARILRPAGARGIDDARRKAFNKRVKKLTPYAGIVEATVMIRHGNERNVFRPDV